MIQQQVDLIKKRIKFLDEYSQAIDKMIADKVDDKTHYELLANQHFIDLELNHKRYLLEQYQRDAKRQKAEQEATIKEVNENMGKVIGELRKKIGLDGMRDKAKKAILNRFKKNDYPMMARKINDYNMAQAIIKWTPPNE